MKTDKQVFRVFQARPEWIFQLASLKSPGPCSFRAFAVKALERDADGLIVPDDPTQPLTIVEFQFQRDDAIYTRVVIEMAAVQESHQMRNVQGIIFFRYNNLDPRTPPWNRVVRSYLLRDLLKTFERTHPRHPLVAVFKPVLVTSDRTLEKEAVQYYRDIKYGELDDRCRTTLSEVFVSWLEQRLKTRGKKEIEAMLLGELPNLEETQSGKDLIRIGEIRGEKGQCVD